VCVCTCKKKRERDRTCIQRIEPQCTPSNRTGSGNQIQTLYIHPTVQHIPLRKECTHPWPRPIFHWILQDIPPWSMLMLVYMWTGHLCFHPTEYLNTNHLSTLNNLIDLWFFLCYDQSDTFHNWITQREREKRLCSQTADRGCIRNTTPPLLPLTLTTIHNPRNIHCFFLVGSCRTGLRLQLGKNHEIDRIYSHLQAY
jgi:hypothetical protein